MTGRSGGTGSKAPRSGERPFRLAIGCWLVVAVGISGFFRRRADEVGGRVSREEEGAPMRASLALAGGGLWLTTLTYVVSPRHVSWARVNLPRQARWLGLAVAFVCAPLLYRVFSSLGENVTRTVATRPEHTLVTSGPYRWVRHPLYTTAGLAFVGLSLGTGSWLLGALTAIGLSLLVRRTRAEERNLEQRFGDDYRAYRAEDGEVPAEGQGPSAGLRSSHLKVKGPSQTAPPHVLVPVSC